MELLNSRELSVSEFRQEYGVSETSLEQIFNNFASQQEEETGPVRGMMQ